MLTVEGDGLREARLQWEFSGKQGLQVVSRQSQGNFPGASKWKGKGVFYRAAQGSDVVD